MIWHERSSFALPDLMSGHVHWLREMTDGRAMAMMLNYSPHHVLWPVMDIVNNPYPCTDQNQITSKNTINYNKLNKTFFIDGLTKLYRLVFSLLGLYGCLSDNLWMMPGSLTFVILKIYH